MKILSRSQRSRLKWFTLLLVCGLVCVYFLFIRMIQPSTRVAFDVGLLQNTLRSQIHVDYKTVKALRQHSLSTVRHDSNPISNALVNEKEFRVEVSMDEYKKGAKTGNPLIDDYGGNDLRISGENGQGVVLTVSQRNELNMVMDKYHLNTLVSDAIPLNRRVPDSRIKGCHKISYNEALPTATIIIPFYNEWPSLLLRTVYSIINRSPRNLVDQIILVDDASTLEELSSLEDYTSSHFPKGLVRLLRLPQRKGLINARMRGIAEAHGDVLILFDSHMEVNIDWLQPLLREIARDKHVVSMATLDYIQPDTFEYRYNVDYLTRYGWDWSMVFFETFFRDDQVGLEVTDPRPGVTMVGAAFAMDREYFHELGGYDEGMSIWGGENLEMAWRVSLCGGKLLHVPCSRIGHVARAQPYSFPQGRASIEHYNFKRAIQVWAGNYSRFVYSVFPDMKNLDVGDLTERYALKNRLKCKDFKRYLDNVWPELNIYDEDALHWGRVRNEAFKSCLDNGMYLFQAKEPLHLYACASAINRQGFTLTKAGRLRTSLQCVVAGDVRDDDNTKVVLEDCIIGDPDLWTYNEGLLVHEPSKRCLDVDYEGLVLTACFHNKITQQWTFQTYDLS